MPLDGKESLRHEAATHDEENCIHRIQGFFSQLDESAQGPVPLRSTWLALLHIQRLEERLYLWSIASGTPCSCSVARVHSWAVMNL